MSFRKALAAAAALLMLAFTAGAQQPYALMNPPQPTEGGGKIEVVEFFWYGCPHCYHLEPALNAWLKNAPKDVVFKRIPAVPSASWEPLASVYYTLEAMGLLDKYHSKVFDAIHKDNENLGNKNVREKWLAKNGIDAKKYEEMEKSFSVVSKVQRAKQLTQGYKVDGVPRIVVNGRYYTSPDQAGGADQRMLAAVDQIIAIARKEKAAMLPVPGKLARR
ncbi:MAG TPA: thiol:disulfide interchange protein DsbA/DsbL [Usitatibacter sp.]|nr:thiol:disulfide interchange protein DsbA/DsbL [Usitatibacter sp.]